MPRDLFVIGLNRKGETSILIGRETDNATTRARFNDWRSGSSLPKGIDEAHLYDSEEGRVGIAFNEAERRKEVYASLIKETEDEIKTVKDNLAEAEAHLAKLTKSGKNNPELGHTTRAVGTFKEELKRLEARLEEASKGADDHAKSVKQSKSETTK